LILDLFAFKSFKNLISTSISKPDQVYVSLISLSLYHLTTSTTTALDYSRDDLSSLRLQCVDHGWAAATEAGLIEDKIFWELDT
jgi:hypothetical protein